MCGPGRNTARSPGSLGERLGLLAFSALEPGLGEARHPGLPAEIRLPSVSEGIPRRKLARKRQDELSGPTTFKYSEGLDSVSLLFERAAEFFI